MPPVRLGSEPIVTRLITAIRLLLIQRPGGFGPQMG
jgi:hypothetical protein